MKSIFEYVMWVDSKTLDTNKKTTINSSFTTNTESRIFHMMCSTPLPKGKFTHNQNGLLWTLRRNHHLQRVSKDFKRIFWNCFSGQERFTLEEKDEFIYTLLRMWNQGNFHDEYLNFSPMPPIADIAMSMRASLRPILNGSIVTTRKCNPDFVRVIVDAGNSEVINYPDSYGYTPLSNAIAYAYFSKNDKNGHLKIVKLLLTHPDIHVNLLPRQEKQKCPLYWATYHGNIEIIKLLLAHSDIQINAVDGYFQGETALFAAVRTSSSLAVFRSVIDLLINAGVDDTIKNKDGQTALDLARNRTYLTDKVEVLEQTLATRKNHTTL